MNDTDKARIEAAAKCGFAVNKQERHGSLWDVYLCTPEQLILFSKLSECAGRAQGRAVVEASLKVIDEFQAQVEAEFGGDSK